MRTTTPRLTTDQSWLARQSAGLASIFVELASAAQSDIGGARAKVLSSRILPLVPMVEKIAREAGLDIGYSEFEPRPEKRPRTLKFTPR